MSGAGRLSARLVQKTLQGALLAGRDPSVLLARAGLDTALYQNARLSVSSAQYQQLLLCLYQEMDDYFIGFMAEPTRVDMLEFLKKETRRCATLKELINTIMRFRHAMRSDIRSSCEENPERDEFTWSSDYDLKPQVNAHLFYWLRLTLMYKVFCWATGKRLKIKRVGFSAAGPADYLDYRIFAADILFNQPHNTLTFDRACLHLPVYPLPEAQMNAHWFSLPPDASCEQQVKQALFTLQQNAIWAPTLSQVAQCLNIGVRALRRKLASEHTSLLAIRNQWRCEQAKTLLLTTATPITDIALQLGFVEPGGFSRAFKHWQGCTPSAYRQQHQQQQCSDLGQVG